jgi:lysophospholipase L1-like esterase
MTKKRNDSVIVERRTLLFFSVIMLLMFAPELFGQARSEFTYKSNGLENDEYNSIQNATHLDDFFEQLYQLRINAKGNVNIIHIGDSHIQADYFTEVVRKDFQQEFGNAGRGLIVTARVAGTNEPGNIKTSSTVTWASKRLIYPLPPLPIGIGGITINTNHVGAMLRVRMNDPLHDYSFNKVTVFFQKDSHSFDLCLRDSLNNELGLITRFSGEPFKNYSSINFSQHVNEVAIQTVQSSEEQKQATLFGIALENGSPGILYHAIGVNGAKYVHYNQALYFARQTHALTPNVFIISLGTNESVDYPYIDRNLFNNIGKLVESLKEFNPTAKFILVTPPGAFRKKIKANPGIEIVREQILLYAVENGLAFWDMYKATGGKDAAQQWRAQGLLRADGIHFTKEGYQYQGDLLYFALMKRYNQYVAVRHP